MSRPNNRRLGRWMAFAGALSLTAGPLSAPSAASTRQGNPPFDFTGAEFVSYIRAGGVETEVEIPASLHQDIGYTGVELLHDPGQAQGFSSSRAATYWLGPYLEEVVLAFPCKACPDYGWLGGRPNLTSHHIYPDPSSWGNRDPDLEDPQGTGKRIAPLPADGNPVLARATAPDDVHASAIGQVANLGGPEGLGTVGSNSQAALDKATGVATTTARAYVSGISSAGPLDTVESLVQVTQRPPTSPHAAGRVTITYRLSFFDSHAANLAGKGFTVSGHDVPAAQLVAQFNQQVAQNSDAIAAVGPFGFKLLAPQVGLGAPDEDDTGGLPYLIAPAVQANLGLKLRKGSIGQNQYVRLASIRWAGRYGPVRPKPPTVQPN